MSDQITLQRSYDSDFMHNIMSKFSGNGNSDNSFKRFCSVKEKLHKNIFIPIRNETVDIWAPENWSFSAVSMVARKYLLPEEKSIKKMCFDVANEIAECGYKEGYFNSKEEKNEFFEELAGMFIGQYFTLNSPAWFNIRVKKDPQVHACYIVNIEDSMESILQNAGTMGKIFKRGSGAGAQIGNLRSSYATIGKTGSCSSGPLSFMKIYDVIGDVTKSGQTARRAAIKFDMWSWHPDIYNFINCKTLEEKKIKVLKDAGYSGGIMGDASRSVFYQNMNISVRADDEFMSKAMSGDEEDNYCLREPHSNQVVKKVNARQLLKDIAEQAWKTGDPGIHFHNTTNKWNTCKNDGVIESSNPCLPPFVSVLTKERGITSLGDCSIGEEIWSSEGWTRILNKWSSGVKEVFEYRTSSGTFYSTSNHKVISSGEKMAVGDAEAIDVLSGPDAKEIIIDPQDVVDGLVIGDGSIHKANKNLVILYIGEDDYDYFESEIKDFIGNVYDNPSYKLKTTISDQELSLTYERKIPNRFVSNPSKICGFLRGLFSANGSVLIGKKSKRVTLKSSSKNIIETTQKMLSAVGIRSYYTTNRPSTVSFLNGAYLCKESYDLNITTDCDKFYSKIGFIQNYKNCNLREILKTKNNCGRQLKISYEIREIVSLGDMEVFDIQVDNSSHTFWCNGFNVCNCGEYNFLPNTACNLGSFNVLKFIKEDNSFDTKRFSKAVMIATMACDIIIDLAGYPTEELAMGSRQYRTIGLGYCNVGSAFIKMLMPYGSKEARQWIYNLTALMQGYSTITSQYLAKRLGQYPAWDHNKYHHSDINAMHATNATVNCGLDCYEKYEMWPEVIKTWNSIDKNEPMRNAQLTCIAPTGTVGFFLGADTFSIEPELAAIKFKELVDGDTIKIVNELMQETIRKNNWATEEQIKEVADGKRSIIDLVPEKHKEVFLTSMPDREGRCIKWEDHIKMVAAAQPFLSGAISKTINLCNTATVEEVIKCYELAWKLGCKSITVYRDGCKNEQPIRVISDDIVEIENKKEELPKCFLCATEMIRQGAHCFVCPKCGEGSGFCSTGRQEEIEY